MKTKCAFVLLLLLFGASFFFSKKIEKQEEVVPTVAGDDLPYPLEVQQAFFAEYLEPVAIKQLWSGKYPIPEIRDRHAYLVTAIAKRYSKPIDWRAVTNYEPVSRYALAGTKVENGVPNLAIFMPMMMDVCAQLRDQKYPDWRERFETTGVVSILHELEHLVGNPDDADINTREGLVTCEKIAWARTCEFTLTPLVETYHKNLTVSDQMFYGSWIKAGRDEKSPVWDEEIRSVYQGFR